jgi:hypothetical protein
MVQVSAPGVVYSTPFTQSAAMACKTDSDNAQAMANLRHMKCREWFELEKDNARSAACPTPNKAS